MIYCTDRSSENGEKLYQKYARFLVPPQVRALRAVSAAEYLLNKQKNTYQGLVILRRMLWRKVRPLLIHSNLRLRTWRGMASFNRYGSACWSPNFVPRPYHADTLKHGSRKAKEHFLYLMHVAQMRLPLIGQKDFEVEMTFYFNHPLPNRKYKTCTAQMLVPWWVSEKKQASAYHDRCEKTLVAYHAMSVLKWYFLAWLDWRFAPPRFRAAGADRAPLLGSGDPEYW